jgi:hypothetical protein
VRIVNFVCTRVKRKATHKMSSRIKYFIFQSIAHNREDQDSIIFALNQWTMESKNNI